MTQSSSTSKNEITQNPSDELDMLNVLATGEDEFDVDLMACGCRLAPVGGEISLHDLVRMYELDIVKLTELVGALYDESGISNARLLELADLASKNKIHEPLRGERGKKSVISKGRSTTDGKKTAASKAKK